MLGEVRTVLVVDDHADFLNVTKALLEFLGFKVLSADSATAALQALQAHLNLDCMLVDVLMPRIDGIDCAREARALRPEVKIGLTSIMPLPYLKSHLGKDTGEYQFLEKPYTVPKLLNFLDSL